MVTCRCGRKIPLRFAFKCFYCGKYFCDFCAAIHFGKTREKYEADKVEKERLKNGTDKA